LRQSSVHEVFVKPVPDVDNPHGRFPLGSGKVERHYYGSQLFVNKFGGYSGLSRVPSFQLSFLHIPSIYLTFSILSVTIVKYLSCLTDP
jgi:hypothetical protein